LNSEGVGYHAKDLLKDEKDWEWVMVIKGRVELVFDDKKDAFL
jgi:hypothetical protein